MDKISSKTPPVLTLDVEKYLTHIQHLDLTPAQKETLIKTLWVLVENFVDRAFEMDCAQQIMTQKQRSHDKVPQTILESSE
ncbi:MAG: hypothetical protein AAF988_04735 [Pseudomonadota bacterium]